ncbi:hypothetical protein bas13_0070 [Escherichia phage LeonhardEuler]|uniref:Uncharacterized protein n=1 Tax=Escherichia phage LeonhardEuler TaxID=2851977 RepID=A0AAE7VVQ8_9CAUD|nr:hypothetical protein [Pseudomonas aeruginosa]MDQ4166609.1 hypothetical protein [Pseudomonas aeruginosa]MDQ4209574.1 hypothetical protein [Pseudomonas aeruginosa]MDQ4334834.1 hypothetical protein [Pseudomonas aeruginosa]QXV82507.1 hypothetical protein bas13_0070 [Escherichia phage LeonhardEuler]
MKFECVSSSGSGFKWGKTYKGVRVNDDSFIITDENGCNVNVVRRHEYQEIFLPYGGSSKYIFHRIVDGVKFNDVIEAINQLHNKEVKFMKFECISDNTKKFTVGKIYDVPSEHAKHTTVITDDTGHNRIATITHNGEGLRWNSGGTKFATFGKKSKRTFCVNDKINTSKISNVKPINVDRKPAMKFEEKADLSILAVALVLLVASISLMFIM